MRTLSLRISFIAIAVCAVASQFLSMQSVWADELKILDHNGLMRLSLEATGRTNVFVEFIPGGKSVENVVLENVDGIQGEIDGQRESSERFTFSQVGEGTWRINVVPAREVARVTTDR